MFEIRILFRTFPRLFSLIGLQMGKPANGASRFAPFPISVDHWDSSELSNVEISHKMLKNILCQ